MRFAYRHLALASLLLAPAPAAAQDEETLERAFVGRSVTVKLDMPANKEGVDVYPERESPLDYEEYGNRIRQYGVSVPRGTPILVTRVKLKKKHLEFQLGGGGYGSWGDDTGSVGISTYVPKSNREKDLEKEVKSENDPARRKRLQRELDDLRRDRESEERHLRLMKEQAEAEKKVEVREKALQGGSRFNVRFDREPASDQLTPEAIRAALAEYVSFEAGDEAGRGPEADRLSGASPGELRKGMLWEDVASLLGPPSAVATRREGRLEVRACSFEDGDRRIEADFVEGVLIRYSISSR